MFKSLNHEIQNKLTQGLLIHNNTPFPKHIPYRPDLTSSDPSLLVGSLTKKMKPNKPLHHRQHLTMTKRCNTWSLDMTSVSTMVATMSRSCAVFSSNRKKNSFKVYFWFFFSLSKLTDKTISITKVSIDWKIFKEYTEQFTKNLSECVLLVKIKKDIAYIILDLFSQYNPLCSNLCRPEDDPCP